MGQLVWVIRRFYEGWGEGRRENSGPILLGFRGLNHRIVPCLLFYDYVLLYNGIVYYMGTEDIRVYFGED